MRTGKLVDLAPVLDIDMGNTRLKWRLMSGDKLVEQGAFSWADYDSFAPGAGATSSIWERVAPHCVSLGRVRVGSVAGAERNQALAAWVREKWGIETEFAQTSAAAAGVRNSYEDPSRMGVDRWLAAVAAYQRVAKACLVVDCGSAVTVELIDATGQHLGGYIVPGLRLMRRALFNDTDAVKVGSQPLPEVLAPGKDTAAAVNNGLPQMVLGLIERAYRQLELTQPGEAEDTAVQVLVTGGDGRVLIAHLDRSIGENAEFVADLVLDGLAIVLP